MYKLFKFNYLEVNKGFKVLSNFNKKTNLINIFRKYFFKKTNFLCKKDYYSKREF